MELPERPPQARKPIAVPKGFKAQPVDWRVHMT